MSRVARYDFQTPEWALPLLEDVRYKGAWGGRGGGKDYFFADKLIEDSLCERGLLSVVIREIQKSLKESNKRLIEERLQHYSLGAAEGFKVFESVIRTPGDGQIMFTGMQDHTADSVKSLQSRKRALWNEAQTASARSLSLLTPTIRTSGAQLWFAWNPEDPPDLKRPETSVDGMFRIGDPRELPGGGVCVEARFDINPFLEDGCPTLLEEAYARRHYQPEDYNHIWRGGYKTRSESRVFKNWSVAEFETPTGVTYRFGADFGFSVDPSVLVRCFIGRWEGGRVIPDDAGRFLFIDYEAYRVGCDVDHTPALFAGNDPRSPAQWKNPYGDPGIDGALMWPITADSSNPQTISYCRRMGLNMKPAKKGPGSIEEGVNFLKAYTIIIHPRCLHTADEFLYYSFKMDKATGLVLPVLADKKNHVIDAVRYAVEDMRRTKGFFG